MNPHLSSVKKVSKDSPLRLLFVSPVTPAISGNGLSMRAANLLQAWAGLGVHIDLLIIPVYGQLHENPAGEIASLSQSLTFLPCPQPGRLARWRQRWRKYFFSQQELDRPIFQRASPAWKRRVADHVEKIHPEVIFVFRSYTAAFIPGRLLRHYPHLLDIDEVDSQVLRQQAAPHARAYARYESRLLPKLSALTVSSEREREKLDPALRWKTRVLPNVYPVRTPSPPRVANPPAPRLLFIGSLGYKPNSDAVRFFVESILPEIVHLESRVQFVVAGTGGPDIFQEWAGHPHLEVTGRVENLAGLYAGVDMVVVPLRFGGGTRIKILEAFSFGKAVVSTSLGGEGLDVASGQHLLFADDPASFAEACIRVLRDADIREGLAQQGRKWFLQHHTPDTQNHILEKWLTERSSN